MQKVFDRLIEAAKRADTDPGFVIEVTSIGIRIKYTFGDGMRIYTTESTTSWEAIIRAKVNPLLLAMTDLRAQAADFRR